MACWNVWFCTISRICSADTGTDPFEIDCRARSSATASMSASDKLCWSTSNTEGKSRWGMPSGYPARSQVSIFVIGDSVIG